MVEKIELTCGRCPRGCQITVEVLDGKVALISGNGCMRGEVYAKNEAAVRTAFSKP